MDKSFLDKLNAISEEIGLVHDRLMAIGYELQALPTPGLSDLPKTEREKDKDIDATHVFGMTLILIDLGKAFCQVEIMRILTAYNFLQKVRNREDEQDYALKKALTREFNQRLRETGLAIRHPDSDQPAVLNCVATGDGTGRYVMENKRTKKRDHTSRSLQDLFPIRFMKDEQRRESFLEQRKKKNKDPE